MRRRQSDIRFMTPKRWAVIILLEIGLVLMLLNLYFRGPKRLCSGRARSDPRG